MAALVPSKLRKGSSLQTNEISWFDKIFPVHSKIAYRSMIGIWICYFTFAFVQVQFAHNIAIENFLVRYFAIALVSVVATWLLYRMMLLMRGGDMFRTLTFVFTLPSFFLALMVAQFEHWMGSRPLFFPELFYGVSSLVGATNILVPYLLLVAWGCIYLALTQNEEMEIAVSDSQKLEKITRESEQRALRYQLNPHFIFNALNSVSSLVVDKKNEQAERLVDELADYMRVVLDDEGREMVTVASEIDQQVRYLEIEKVRFPHRLHYESKIAKNVEELKIPALIIQPLVENAIKHGVARSSSEVVIVIEAMIEKDRLKISVANTGRMKLPKAKGDSLGTGLSNISDRLKVIYGPSAALVTGNSYDDMTVATVVIPMGALK